MALQGLDSVKPNKFLDNKTWTLLLRKEFGDLKNIREDIEDYENNFGVMDGEQTHQRMPARTRSIN